VTRLVKTPETGYIPALLFIRTVEVHMNLGEDQWEEDDPRLAPLTEMWEFSDLRKQLGIRQNGGRIRMIPFGLADLILCKLNLVELWRGPLADVYYAASLEEGHGLQWVRPVPKGYRRCERVGCSEVFAAKMHRGRAKRYCTTRCGDAESKARRVGSRSQIARANDTCPSGHDRSPENVYEYTIKSGPKAGTLVRRCRPCFNAAQAAYREQVAA